MFFEICIDKKFKFRLCVLLIYNDFLQIFYYSKITETVKKYFSYPYQAL